MAYKSVTININVEILVYEHESILISNEFLKENFWQEIRENVHDGNYEIKSFKIEDESYPE